MKARMETKTDILIRLRIRDPHTELLECPACDTKLTPYEVAQHCEEEIEQLRNVQLKADALIENDANKDNANTEEQRKPWTVFQRVQRNRQSRLKQRLRKRPLDEPAALPERSCPMCDKSFPQSEIEQHAEACLRRSSNEPNGVENESSDEEGDGEQYEEYEWAGQKRIRVSSLLQGGYAALGIGSNGSSRVEACAATDEEEDLNVDEDDTHIYGPAQYGESDIITTNAECNGEINENDVSNDMHKTTLDNCSNISNGKTAIPPCSDENAPRTAATSSNGTKNSRETEKTNIQQQIIDSMKAKLRQYEKHLQSKFKCLICLDDYRNPAISVSCWHVHCEECWLRSLGARKLCPRCNLITTPNDLRRIYM